jgi:hypothetical protein
VGLVPFVVPIYSNERLKWKKKNTNNPGATHATNEPPGPKAKPILFVKAVTDFSLANTNAHTPTVC